MSSVLIVDDEPDIRESLKQVIELMDCKVTEAEDGADFLKKVGKIKPDLVVLDVMMPGLTTTDILERVKKLKLSVKILLVTAVVFTVVEEKKFLKDPLVVGYVRKPFKLAELREKISEQIKK